MRPYIDRFPQRLEGPDARKGALLPGEEPRIRAYLSDWDACFIAALCPDHLRRCRFTDGAFIWSGEWTIAPLDDVPIAFLTHLRALGYATEKTGPQWSENRRRISEWWSAGKPDSGRV